MTPSERRLLKKILARVRLIGADLKFTADEVESINKKMKTNESHTPEIRACMRLYSGTWIEAYINIMLSEDSPARTAQIRDLCRGSF